MDQSTSKLNKLVAIDSPFPPVSAKILRNFPSENGYLLKLFRMWANSPRHLKKFAASSLLDEESPISIKLRELIILRTTALNKCEYEWGVHVSVFANKVGLTKEQIQNTISTKVDASLWDAQELLLIKVVDELCHSAFLSAELKVDFQKAFSIEEQLEVFALCGFYTTVAFTANNSEIDLEDFAAKFEDYK